MRTFGALLAILLAAPLDGEGEHAPIKVEYPQQGMTLRVTSRCAEAAPCPFAAEVDAPPETFARIRKVDYTWVPVRRKSPAPITDARTHFRIDGAQTEGELIWAEVVLEGAKEPVLLKGEIPFAVVVRPALPTGMRFEVKYQEEYLEGTASGNYHYRVWLRGDPAAMKKVRSVEYRVPPEFGIGARQANTLTEYFFEGGSSSRQFDITAIIRWSNGKKTTYAIPFQPQ